MPKAPVDKDGYPLGPKGKVGLSWQIEMPSPAGDLCPSQDGKKNTFCRLVALRPDARHISRALFPS
jgi:hypothetical protein